MSPALACWGASGGGDCTSPLGSKPWLNALKQRLDFGPFKEALATHEWAIWPFCYFWESFSSCSCLVPVVARGD